MFSKLLLIACICIVIALILYFFYWNRFIAFILAQIIRVLYWNQEGSSIWVEIGSIHFSLPAGRILFKDLCYHSSNQTIKIVKGQLQWRYWIRRPMTEEEISTGRGRRWLSCRIHISFQGFEWFMYNRTASFDNIVSQMESNLNRSTSRFSEGRRSKSRQDGGSTAYPPASSGKRSLPIPLTIQRAFNWLKNQLPSLDPKDLLPLGVEVTTGAIILGNASTPSLLVAEFQNADGTFGVVPSRSKYDLYKQNLNLKFQHALVRYVDNEDYVESMNCLGAILHDRIKRYNENRTPRSYMSYRSFGRLWRQVGLFSLVIQYFQERREQRAFQRSLANSLASNGKSKKKEIRDETPIGIDFSTHEYAIERKILEAPSLELTYFVDVVGEVPPLPHVDPFSRGDIVDVGNGGTAPEWGFHLVVKSGFIRYGPWADRQRAELQRAFFPPSYQDTQPTTRLKPGDKRLWTALQVFIELRDETTLHIPFRESSKDWQWDGKSTIPRRPRRREPASINVTVGDLSSINYVMPMAVGEKGYEPVIEIHLDTIAVSSSLNDIKLISAESCRIRCEHPSPLPWNQVRTWTYSITLRQPVLFLLRDHINMFTDLGKDWASGPPTDWQKFVPMIYVVKLKLHHYEINLYANDHNIIDKPLIRDENALLTLSGLDLQTKVTMPSNKFRPLTYCVPFIVDAPDVSFNLSVPRWSTHALHAPRGGYSILKADALHLEGSYRYYGEVHEEHVDQLKLDIQLTNAALKALGWAIRYIMVIKDNYFGSFTHFSTLNEYLGKRDSQDQPVGDPIKLKYREGKHNMLQVELSLDVDRGTAVLPSGLLGYRTSSFNMLTDSSTATEPSGSALMLAFPRLQVYLRLHDYFMEMTLNVDTVRGLMDTSVPEKMDYKTLQKKGKEVLFIDGIDVVANRLFGPQPNTSTYLCIWEISLGSVKGQLTAFEAKAIAAAGNAFKVHFVDAVNAPADKFMPPLDPDITFYKIGVASAELVWKTPTAALVVSLEEGIKFASNDLASNHYRKVISLQIPRINVKVLVTSVSSRGTSWLEAGEVVADAYLDIYDVPKDYRAQNKAQTDYVEEQDQLTGRVKRMLADLRRRDRYTTDPATSDDTSNHAGSMFLPQPLLPTSRRPQPKPRAVNLNRHSSSHSRRRQPSWRPSTLGHFSDSDGDDALSEADRDAHVAKARFSVTRLPLQEREDDSMSSGDESDDADLTDGDSLNSDWSDIADSPNATPDSSMLSFFSPLTRHYYVNPAGSPGRWGGSAFTLARDKSPLKVRRPSLDTDPRPFTPLPIGLSDQDGQCGTTIVRIRTRKPSEIKLTPLLIVASVPFEEDISNIPLDPEMSVDSMMSAYLDRLLKDEKCPSFLLLDIGLSSTGLVLFHHTSPSITTPPDGQLPSPCVPSKLDTTSILDIGMTSAHLTIGKLDKELALRGAIGKAFCNVDTSLDKRTLSSTKSEQAAFNLSISDLSVELSRQSLHCYVRDIYGKIGHRGPAIMVSMALSVLQSVKTATARMPQLKDDRQTDLRDCIYNILTASQNRPIVDTLSIIQPSFLVQDGIPWRLRSDPGFRFLYHLRNCIDTPVPGPSSVSVDDLTALLDDRLFALEQDNIKLADLPDLLTVFKGAGVKPESPPGPKMRKNNQISSISLELNQAVFTVFDISGSTATELKLTESKFMARKEKVDLVHFSTALPTSMSQTSLREKPRPLRRFAVSAALGDTNVAVFPQLMSFIQEALRVRRQTRSPSKQLRAPTQPNPSIKVSKLVNINVLVSLRRLRIRAAAANLVFELGLVGFQGSSAMLSATTTTEFSNNHVANFEEIYLQARSPSSPEKESQHDILAAVALQGGKANYLSKAGHSVPLLSHRVVFSLEQFRIDVPRSAMRLYRFAEEWRADYLPGIESTVKAMLSEIDTKSAAASAPPTRSPTAHDVELHVNASVNRVRVTLQVMHGTWLTWEVEKIIGYLKSPVKSSGTSPTYTFGVQLGSMILNISSSKLHEAASGSRVRLQLPPMSVAGDYDGSCVRTLALVEFIELKVKPSHWDTLLAVQQKFGQDFNDFLNLVQETRQNRPAPEPKPNPGPSINYGVFVKMKGFRVGLEGLSSTLYLECVDIRGGLNNANGVSWDIGLTGLALSLAPRALGGLPYNRQQRSAFVSIDFKVTGGDNNRGISLVKTLDLSVTKIHAVMQASSIGEVGDFIDHLQAEMLDRQEQRAIELAEFKEKTQSILKTFDVKVRDVPREEARSWLGDYIINVSIQNIGVAFPLAHDHQLDVGRSADAVAVRAFLFSIRSITFRTDRGETGEALMEKLCFQFVPKFRQSSPEDFAADRHHARNCLVYPEMRAQLRSSTVASSRKVWIDANVDGFLLDLDSSVPDYVFSLVDVYRKGKERVERLSATIPRTPSAMTPSVELPKPYDRHYTEIPTSNVFASLRFSSGKVRAYSVAAVKQFRSRSLSLSTASQDLTDEQVLDMGAEVFNLPTVSVWAEYRATPAARKLTEKDGERPTPSLLMFKSTVHSSRNVLRPQLLPFLTEVLNRVETRMRKISSLPPHIPGTETPVSMDYPQPKLPSSNTEAVSSMQLSFSLRIDKSRLELTCQPDVNVVAAVNWESGGFTLNVSPGARRVSFTGAVGGLAIGLRHGFLSEDCVNLDARNLTFSIAFSKMDTLDGRTAGTVSAILDTEFLGGVRFSRLQDILCFKAVWLDRIPIWNSYAPPEAKNIPKTIVIPASPVEPTRDQSLSTVILIRIRQIKVSVDLGQSICFTVLDLKNAVLRTKITDMMQELSIFVEDVSVTAKGNLSGRIHVPDCLFQTIRRSEQFISQDEAESRMLELMMTSGPLVAMLESDHQRLLHYRAEPLEVQIFDDWSLASGRFEEDRSLQLSFVVRCPEIAVVATIGTIPKMMSYANRFKSNLEAQRQGASRESKTFRATRAPKPDNPLSAVAEAMLHSARTRFKEVESGLAYVVRQKMSARLDLLRLIVFPRSMNDVEIAQFVGRRVIAQFDRLVASDTMPAKRDLRLSFYSMTISKHTQNQAMVITPSQLEALDGREWLEEMFKGAAEATIVGLPAMNMHMVSEEVLQEASRQLVYDFRSRFIRTEGMKAYEDIFITLNMSLYTWLTVLRKSLTREMDQVRATEDWRSAFNPGSSPNPPVGNNGNVRKKVPEPLELTHDFLSPAPENTAVTNPPPMSISAPSTAKLAADQPSRSSSIKAPRSATIGRDRSSSVNFPSSSGKDTEARDVSPAPAKRNSITYEPRERHIERLTMRQLGEATPDVMHPFFMKKAGFNLEDSLPQYVHEYAAIPLEEIMEVLLKIYSQQLLKNQMNETISLPADSPIPDL
ncbi:hypothetical protein CC1G_04554 [Coprinopsis cinerea okayama7|uniref:Csf1 N-terminal domain-containing protein n=1 Tax=Coprinopsis cinerea (strain Okayama-7 / 130 / ATCC MYA-4618 / FGSC 9003) TaxID=240176 RepID=A8N5H6_COPC7|nr:hypothetical protein CC1G_04554 [Coprinopsis cinerea okayama7\|eukprot:XP_001830121.1 hypothetical protein CC1G_04554 [Coprinopsis cinerea okayama7\